MQLFNCLVDCLKVFRFTVCLIYCFVCLSLRVFLKNVFCQACTHCSKQQFSIILTFFLPQKVRILFALKILNSAQTLLHQHCWYKLLLIKRSCFILFFSFIFSPRKLSKCQVMSFAFFYIVICKLAEQKLVPLKANSLKRQQLRIIMMTFSLFSHADNFCRTTWYHKIIVQIFNIYLHVRSNQEVEHS